MVKIRTREELAEYNVSKKVSSLDFSEWENDLLYLKDVCAMNLVITGGTFSRLIMESCTIAGDTSIKDLGKSQQISIRIESCNFRGKFEQSNIVTKHISIKLSEFNSFSQSKVVVDCYDFEICNCLFKGEVYQELDLYKGNIDSNIFQRDVVQKIYLRKGEKRYPKSSYDFLMRYNRIERVLDQSKSEFLGYYTLMGSVNLKRYVGVELSKDEIELIRLIPFDLLDMEKWHSDDEWEYENTMEGIHRCGTTHCIRGFAEVHYFLNHKKLVDDVSSLANGLKYLFHRGNKDAREEILRLREKYKDVVTD